MGKSDYAEMGHGEVVGLKIPESSFKNFADVYFKLFDSENGERTRADGINKGK